MKNNRILIILSIILVFITIYIIRDTYGLLESKNKMIMDSNIAKWNVLINGLDIKSGNNFIVDTINIENSDDVLDGKIAPGGKGYFDINFIDSDGAERVLYYYYEWFSIKPDDNILHISEGGRMIIKDTLGGFGLKHAKFIRVTYDPSVEEE